MAIFKKQNAYWIDYYYKGKRIREKIGLSYQLAKEVLLKRKLEIAEDKFFPERFRKKLLFSDLLDKYWELHGKYLKSHSWEGMLDKIKEYLSNKKCEEITALDISSFYNQIKEKASTSTANRYLTLLKMIFNKGIKWEMIDSNPATKVAKGKEPPGRLRYLSIDEIKNLLNDCDKRILPIVLIALFTGMRRGEILKLKWKDVDLENDVISLKETKSGKGRIVPIMPQLKELFLNLKKNIICEEDKIFSIPLITLRRYFEKALKKANISDFKFHDLRHTFASYFIMTTNDLSALQQILGHSTPIMTQRYAHLSKDYLYSRMGIYSNKVNFWFSQVPMDTNMDTNKSITISKNSIIYREKAPVAQG
jgi:integrase